MSWSANALQQYYLTNFTLLYHHKIDFRILEDLMPWERELYLNLLTSEIEQENLRIQAKNAQQRTAGKKGRTVKKHK